MARKTKPEVVQVGGFYWRLDHPASEPDRERWLVELGGISVAVTYYQPDDKRGGYFSGWRVFSGAPLKEEYLSRDDAMRGAHKQIRIEVNAKRDYVQRMVEDTRAVVKKCEEAGLDLTPPGPVAM